MKARIGGKTVEIPDERVRGGVSRQALGEESVAVSRQPGATPSPLPGWPKASDKWNYSFAQHLELEKQAGRVHCWWYEPLSIWLPGQVRYKPDFMIQRVDGGRLEMVEVKGWSRNLRDGITRYKVAASLFPCFLWKMVKRKGHGWEEYSS